MAASIRLPGVDLARTLHLDSPYFMHGNLHDEQEARPRFSLNTRLSGYGPSTTINAFRQPSEPSQPQSQLAETNEVGVVEWRLSSIGRPKTIVKALSQGKTLTLGALMKSYAFGSKRYFGGLGDKDVQWQERDGTWQCSWSGPSHGPPQILAVLHSRMATRGTRIEVSTEGAPQMDTIVLTALLVLHSETDWKSFTNRAVPSPYSFHQQRLVLAPVPHITALTLTLSTNSFLDGVLAVGGQLMYGLHTRGNRTSITKYTWEERPRLEEFASIEWHSTAVFGRQRSILSYKGQSHILEDFLFSHFLGNRMRRFGMPEFIPWLQWIENPPSWTCVSHPGRHPLAILDRRFMSAGTTLDVTMEGLEFLDALVISCIFVVHSPMDWKRGQALRRHNTPERTRPASRPPNPRSVSANDVLDRTDREDADQEPPGLSRRASDSRISRVSGDSEIPEYTPPPRGLIVHYHGGYIDPRPEPTPSATVSRLNLPVAQFPAILGASTPHASASVVEIGEAPPPSYHPPNYESS